MSDRNWELADSWGRGSSSDRVCPDCGAVVGFSSLAVHEDWHYRNQMREDLDDY